MQIAARHTVRWIASVILGISLVTMLALTAAQTGPASSGSSASTSAATAPSPTPTTAPSPANENWT